MRSAIVAAAFALLPVLVAAADYEYINEFTFDDPTQYANGIEGHGDFLATYPTGLDWASCKQACSGDATCNSVAFDPTATAGSGCHSYVIYDDVNSPNYANMIQLGFQTTTADKGAAILLSSNPTRMRTRQRKARKAESNAFVPAQ